MQILEWFFVNQMNAFGLQQIIMLQNPVLRTCDTTIFWSGLLGHKGRSEEGHPGAEGENPVDSRRVKIRAQLHM
jgi:hypothetical protein